MKNIFLLCIVVLIGVSSCFAKDLLVGSSSNAQLVWQHKAKSHSIPFIKRVKTVFYSDPTEKNIKAIVARDLKHSNAHAIIADGGVGYPFVNIQLESERGSGLDYDIKIYA